MVTKVSEYLPCLLYNATNEMIGDLGGGGGEGGISKHHFEPKVTFLLVFKGMKKMQITKAGVISESFGHCPD